MAAKAFTKAEWEKINAVLDKHGPKYGFPQRVYGSVLLGSFNIRKLGSTRNRDRLTWDFLARVCRQFDLLAVQEIQDDLSGLRRLMDLLGNQFGMIVSDRTGGAPGKIGMCERLGFIFRWSVVQRTEVVSDISYDRSAVLQAMLDKRCEINQVLARYAEALADYEAKKCKKPKNPKIPVFVTFARQPFCVAFRIVGHPGEDTYKFMGVNAHLYFGDYMSDRRQEFCALMDWIIARMTQSGKAYYPNFMLLGDLNLDFDNPQVDRKRIERYMKTFNDDAGDEFDVNFPFLDPHQGHAKPFKTNVRLSEAFDQIGLFFRDRVFPTFIENPGMGTNPVGPDYGVFNFPDLFSKALKGTVFSKLTKNQRTAFVARFEHKVSDHMPLWLRLPLPGA